ncbi:MAG: 50S ribosomal protein L11 [bacterium]
MAKKIMKKVKVEIRGGQANPAPPIGTALGPTGVNIMDFCNQFNDKTKDKMGVVIPCAINIYEDRTFDFIMKQPPAAVLIKAEIGLAKGSANSKKDKVATMTRAQLRSVAEKKMEDLNAHSIEQAEKVIAGTARSMGIEVEK